MNINKTLKIVLFLVFTLFHFSLLSQSKSILENTKLDASKYHKLKAGLKNSQIKFEQNKKGRVAFLGGSITHNPGWRDSVSKYLTQRFPKTKFEFINAGVSSMGTTSAAFRVKRDVLSKGTIDLLFEEAAVNDAAKKRGAVEQIKGMEGIVRHLRTANDKMDIVMIHFATPGNISSYNKGEIPEVITNHNIVATHYQIPIINLAKEVTKRIHNKEFTWKTDFKDIHPSPFGQGIYSKSILQFLDNAYSIQLDCDDKVTPYNIPNKINKYSYDKGGFIPISKAKLTENWKIDPSWQPKDGRKTRKNYVNVPMLVCEIPNSTLKLKFKGNAVGITVVAGPDAGFISYRIDKKPWKILNLFTRHSKNLHLPWYYTLASNLTKGRHVLEIKTTEKKDKKSNGNACRIHNFYINKF